MGIFDAKFTNIFGDTEIVDSSPDAEKDWFYVTDYGRDHDYWQAKIADIFKIFSTSPSTDCQIIYGGLVTDAGGGGGAGDGKIDISEGVAIGKDVSGNVRLFKIPALTNVTVPAGYKNGSNIWVIGKYDFKLAGDARFHFRGTSYDYTLQDTYLGDYTSGSDHSENTTSVDNLFTQTDPNSSPDTVVCWGRFTMTAGDVFTSADTGARSPYFTMGRRSFIKQYGTDDYLSGLRIQESGTLDTWGMYVGTDEDLHFGYATHASGANEHADFTDVFVINDYGVVISKANNSAVPGIVVSNLINGAVAAIDVFLSTYGDAVAGMFLRKNGGGHSTLPHYGYVYNSEGPLYLAAATEVRAYIAEVHWKVTTDSVSVLNTDGVGGDDRLFHVEAYNSGTNATTYVQRLSHSTSQTATTGFGVGLEFELENASGTMKVAHNIQSYWSDATNASEDASLIIQSIAAGTLATRLFMSSDGKIATGGEVSPDVVAGGVHLEVSATGDAFVIKNGATENLAITNLGRITGGSSAGVDMYGLDDTFTYDSFTSIEATGLITVFFKIKKPCGCLLTSNNYASYSSYLSLLYDATSVLIKNTGASSPEPLMLNPGCYSLVSNHSSGVATLRIMGVYGTNDTSEILETLSV